MKNYIIAFLFLLSFFSHAQVNLDSLLTVWNDQQNHDSIRTDAFVKYVWDGFLYSNTDSALVLANVLTKYSKKKKYLPGLGASYNLKGVAYYVKSDFSKALKNYEQAHKIAQELNNLKRVANTLSNMGIIYQSTGQPAKALKYYNKSLSLHKTAKNKKGIGSSLTNIGIIYDDLGDHEKAIDYHLEALDIYKEIGNFRGIPYALHNIGTNYLKSEDYENALKYNLLSLKEKEKIGHKQGMAYSLNNLGIIYRNQSKYNEALDYLNRSLSLFEDIGDKIGISFTTVNIGTISNNLGKHNIAIKNCKEGLEMSSTINAILEQMEACECLYEAYKTLGNDNKALEYHEQMLVFNDSLKSEETAKKLQQMEFAKQVLADSLIQVEKDLHVEMIHKEEVRKKDKNRNLAIGAGVFFLVLSGGFYSRWRFVKKTKAIIEKEKDRSENLLLNILPSEIAEELKAKGSADARDFDLVSILFTDFKGFTQASEKLTPKELIGEINHCFKAFDLICEKYGIEKIKTIGDAYMAAGGLPVPSDNSITNTVLAALEMQAFISERILIKEANNEISFKMRLGIHSGPVVAGIVGVKKFQYDIWGDTVNTASRMESSGEVGKVNVSEGTYKFIKDDPQFIFESRGKIQAKGKGEMKMFFISKSIIEV